MAQRRLVLNRETLVTLDPDQLDGLAAGAVSRPSPLCFLSNPQYSCPTCGIACTTQCPSWDCS